MRNHTQRFGDIQAKTRHGKERDSDRQQDHSSDQSDDAGTPLFPFVVVTHAYLNPLSGDHTAMPAQRILSEGYANTALSPGLQVRGVTSPPACASSRWY